MKYFVEIEADGGVTQRLELLANAAQLGSGPSADLRVQGLPNALASIEARPDGAFVRLLNGNETSLLTNGVASREAVVAWGADAFVQRLRLSFIAEEDAKRGTSPVLLLALGAAVVWLGWRGGDAATAQSAPFHAPLLSTAAATCAERSVEGARRAAAEAEREGTARWQRYSFDLSEGLKAAKAFRLAEGCFAAANDSTGQGRLAEERGAVERRLNSDQTSLRLRLDAALSQQDWEVARSAVRRLDALVAPAGATEFRGGLASTMRWIDARSSGR
jgi:hypothetical protein